MKDIYLSVLIELPTGKYKAERVCIVAEDYIDAKITHRTKLRGCGYDGIITIREISKEEYNLL